MNEKANRKKVRKKLIWDERGVSEIIADILILSMTVVLFAVIFAFVFALPVPDEGTYAEFDSDLKLISEGGVIEVTHEGGEDLPAAYTSVYIFKNLNQGDEDIRQLKTKNELGDTDNPNGYGLTGDGTWSASEKWTYFFGGLDSSDEVVLKIIDQKFGSLIMSAKLLGANLNDVPIVMERWYAPSQVVNGSEMTIYAKVMDADGYSDIDSVFVNVNALNSGLGDLEMSFVKSLSNEVALYRASFDVNTEAGGYMLTVEAMDDSNNIDRGRMNVRIHGRGVVDPVIAMVSIKPNVVDKQSDFIVRAYIYDPNDDLDPESVYVDMSAINSGFKQMTETTNPGVFQASGTAPENTGLYIFLINATDYEGHTALADVPLTVVEIIEDVGGWYYNGTWNTSLGGIAYGESTPYGDYGYDFFNEEGLPNGTNPGGTGTREFDVGESVYCRVRSTVLQNLINKNTFILREMNGDIVESITIEYDYIDQSTWPYYPGAFGRMPETYGVYYEYGYDFDTTGLTPGVYSVEIKMEDNRLGDAGHHFYASDTLFIGVSPDSAVPVIKLYYDSDGNGYDDDDPLWNEYEWWAENPPFGLNTIYTMYVRVTVIDANDPPVIAGDVEIEDFFGGNPVKARPGTYPVGAIEKFGDTNSYVFPIDLIGRNGDIWLPGRNWYTVRLRTFEDDANDKYEGMFTLADITAPMKNIDIVSVMKGKKDGGGVGWYRGDDWPRTTIQTSTPKHAEALATGDVDGDGDIDVVVGSNEDKTQNIAWFENTKADGSGWVAHFLNTDPLELGKKKAKFPKVSSVAVADLDGDGDGEIIAGMQNDVEGGMGLHVFVNDGWWTDTLISADAVEGWEFSVPVTKHGNDNTGESIENAEFDDGTYYVVSSATDSETLYFREWGDSDGKKLKGKDKLETAKLWVSYSVSDASYSGTNYINYSEDGGAWIEAILVTNSVEEVTTSFNLPVGDFKTLDDLGDKLHVMLENDDGTGIIESLYFTDYGANHTADNKIGDMETPDEKGLKVDKGKELHVITPFDTSLLDGDTIYNIALSVVYKSDKKYEGTYPIEYRKGSSDNWHDTTITPIAGDDWVAGKDSNFMGEYNITTKEEIEDLEIRFINDDPKKAVEIDYIGIEVTTEITIDVNIDRMWIQYQYEAKGKKKKVLVGEIAVGDLNNDGWIDIVTADGNGDTRVFINKMGIPGNEYNYSAFSKSDLGGGGGGKQQHIRLAFMEGASDDDLDIIRTNNVQVMIHANNGDGTFAGGINVNSGGDIQKEISAIAVGDMNGDNKVDIVIGTMMKKRDVPSKLWIAFQGNSWSTPNDWEFYPVIMDEVFEWVIKKGKEVGVGDVEVGDTDADGDLDIVVGMGGKKRKHEITGNLWHFVNNCTEATWGDPDGADKGEDPTWIMWYRQEQIPINPWIKDSNEEVFNVELGYIDLT